MDVNEYLQICNKLQKFETTDGNIKEGAISCYNGALEYAKLIARQYKLSYDFRLTPEKWVRVRSLNWVRVFEQDCIIDRKLERQAFEESFEAILIASKGSKKYFILAKAICAECLKRHVPLPVASMEWLSDVLSERISTPTSDGLVSIKNNERNMHIWLLVYKLQSFEWLSLTRNDASSPKSICDIVAKAFGMSYQSVVSIYYNR